jgi:hypothetical protein
MGSFIVQVFFIFTLVTILLLGGAYPITETPPERPEVR